MWVSLIWAKRKLPAAVSAPPPAPPCATTGRRRWRSTEAPCPPTPCTREIRADRWSPCEFSLAVCRFELPDDHGRLHVRVQRAEVLIAAGTREDLREAVFVTEAGRSERPGRRGDRVRFLVVIRPRHRRAHTNGQDRRRKLEFLNGDGCRAPLGGVRRRQPGQDDPHDDHNLP